MVLKGGRKSFVVSLPTYRFEKSASLLFLKWRVTSWGQPKKDDSNLKLSLFSFFLEENSLVMKLSCQSNSALSAVHFTTTTCWRIIGIPQQTDREVKLLPFSTRLQHRDFNEETLNSSWRIPIRKTSSLLLPTTSPKLSIQLWFSKIWISRQNTIKSKKRPSSDQQGQTKIFFLWDNERKSIFIWKVLDMQFKVIFFSVGIWY